MFTACQLFNSILKSFFGLRVRGGVKKKIKGGLTLLLFILQTACAECSHNWVNTLRKYETDYACHKHATKMHKIPHDTCKCRLRRLSSGPLDSDSEWVEDQTYDITKYLWGEGRKIIFFPLLSSTTAPRFSVQTSHPPFLCAARGRCFLSPSPSGSRHTFLQAGFCTGDCVQRKILLYANRNPWQLHVRSQPVNSLTCTKNNTHYLFCVCVKTLQLQQPEHKGLHSCHSTFLTQPIGLHIGSEWYSVCHVDS